MKSTLSYLLILCSLFTVLHRTSGRIPIVLCRYPYGNCTEHNPYRRTFRQKYRRVRTDAACRPRAQRNELLDSPDTRYRNKMQGSLLLQRYEDTGVPQFTLDYRRVYTGLRFHDLDACIGYTEISPPRPRKPVLSPRRNSNACLLLRPSQRLFHFCRNDRTFPFSHFPIHL